LQQQTAPVVRSRQSSLEFLNAAGALTVQYNPNCSSGTRAQPKMRLPDYGAPMSPNSAAILASLQQSKSDEEKSVLDLAYEFGLSDTKAPPAVSAALPLDDSLDPFATPRDAGASTSAAEPMATIDFAVEEDHNWEQLAADSSAGMIVVNNDDDGKTDRERELEYEMHVMESEMLQAMSRAKQLEESLDQQRGRQARHPNSVKVQAKREKELEKRWKEELKEREAAEFKVFELETTVKQLESRVEDLEEQLEQCECGAVSRAAEVDPFATPRVAITHEEADPFGQHEVDPRQKMETFSARRSGSPLAGLDSSSLSKRRGSMPVLGTPVVEAHAKLNVFATSPARAPAPTRSRAASCEADKERKKASATLSRVSRFILFLAKADSDVVVVEHNNPALEGKIEKFMLILGVNQLDLRNKSWEQVNGEIRELAKSHRPLTLTFQEPEEFGSEITHTFNDDSPLGIRWADRLKLMNDEVNALEKLLMGTSRSKSPTKFDRKIRQSLDTLNAAVNTAARKRAKQVALDRDIERSGLRAKADAEEMEKVEAQAKRNQAKAEALARNDAEVKNQRAAMEAEAKSVEARSRSVSVETFDEVESSVEIECEIECDIVWGTEAADPEIDAKAQAAADKRAEEEEYEEQKRAAKAAAARAKSKPVSNRPRILDDTSSSDSD